MCRNHRLFSFEALGSRTREKVGIIGIGGLGHMAIKIAKAMKAHVTVFTTSPSKIETAKELGADEAVLSTDANQMGNLSKFDMILDTVSARHDVNMYLNLLKVDGSLVLVGLPNQPLEVGAFNIVNGRKSFFRFQYWWYCRDTRSN